MMRGEELSKAIKTMAIGDIMPGEEDDDERPSISIQANPSTSTTNDQNQLEGNSRNSDSPQEDDQMASTTTPKECHLTTVKRIMRYFKYSPNIGLWYL
jgi:hypothetical protein